MSARDSTLPHIFAELRRRKVWQVAAVYVVAALAVCGGANDILPRLQLPDWTVTFVIVLTILGFPIAIALAWKTPRPALSPRKRRGRIRGMGARPS